MRTTRPLFALLVGLGIACGPARVASAHHEASLRVAITRGPDRLAVVVEADDPALPAAAVVTADGAAGSVDVSGARSAAGRAWCWAVGDPHADLLVALALPGVEGAEAVVRIGEGARGRVVRVELPGSVRVSAIPAPGPSADVATFFASGVEHILFGADHLAFLLVLVVVARRLGEVLRVATAFTIAHSATLALAAFDVVRVPSTPVEVAIAASIVVAAAWNLLDPAAGHRSLAAFGFGLVHGLGFSSGLSDLLAQAPTSQAAAVLGFNLGVEAGQLAVLFVAAPLLLWWRRAHDVAYRTVVVRGASIAVAIVGAWWVVERVSGAGA